MPYVPLFLRGLRRNIEFYKTALEVARNSESTFKYHNHIYKVDPVLRDLMKDVKDGKLNVMVSCNI